MKNNLTDEYIDSLQELALMEYSPIVVTQAKRCLIDYLAVTFAGAKMLEEKTHKLLCSMGLNDDRGSSLIGMNRRAPLKVAAFINGLNAHVAELDDGVISGIIHPGSPILSALLPIAEYEGVSGEDLIRGIVIGYESSVRLADAIQPSHKRRGYHGSGTCGAIGAALGIAAMMKLPLGEWKKALSAAAVGAGGSLKVLENSSELKPFNVAKAAEAGMLSVFMAQASFEGPDDALAGNNGFLKTMSDEQDLSHLTRSNQLPLAVERVYVKPYAACRYCHSAIDAALLLKAKHNIQPDDIASIHVRTYLLAVEKHDHTIINNMSSARMSIPYSVGVSLIRGKAGLQEFFNDCREDPDVISTTKKVSVSECETLTALFPQNCAAELKITLGDGRCYEVRVDNPKGDPETALSHQELENKFSSLLKFSGSSEADAGRMLGFLWNLENDLPQLIRNL